MKSASIRLTAPYHEHFCYRNRAPNLTKRAGRMFSGTCHCDPNVSFTASGALSFSVANRKSLRAFTLGPAATHRDGANR